MPLARILTDHPEAAALLSDQLRRSGYAVEIVGAQETPATAADLEIQFELCPREQALALAAERAREQQADVLVATGALDGDGSMAPSSAGEPAASAVEPMSESAARPAVPSISMPARIEHPKPAPISHSRPAPVPAALNRMPEPSKPAQPIYGPGGIERRQIQRRGAVLSLLDAWRMEFSRAGRAFSEAVRRKMRKASPEVQEALQTARTRLAAFALQVRRSAGPMTRSALAAIARFTRAAASDARHVLHAAAQRLQSRNQPSSGHGSSRRTPNSRQDFTGVEPASAGPGPGLATGPGETVSDAAPAAAVSAAPHAGSTLSGLPVALIASARRIRLREDRPQLRAVLTGSLAAAIFFALGMAVALMSPRTPLPEDLRSGGVTVQASQPAHSNSGGVTVQADQINSGVTVQAGRSASASAAAPAAHAPAASGPPAPQSARPSAGHRTSPGGQPSPLARHSSSTDDGGVANDVTVRHFAPPKPPPSRVQASGMKHYSDIDN